MNVLANKMEECSRFQISGSQANDERWVNRENRFVSELAPESHRYSFFVQIFQPYHLSFSLLVAAANDERGRWTLTQIDNYVFQKISQWFERILANEFEWGRIDMISKLDDVERVSLNCSLRWFIVVVVFCGKTRLRDRERWKIYGWDGRRST